MRRTALIAAVGSVLAIASFSEAAFTLSAAPSVRPSTAAGTSAYDIFALNDVGGTDGNALQGLQFTFTGTNGTQVLFATEDNGDGTFGNDTYNFSSTTSSTNPAPTDPNRSNLRIGSATLGEHTFTNAPSNFNINKSTFSADYALLSSATATTRAPATVPPGARFARLVFNTVTPTFNITGNFGGEIGTKSPASLTFPGVVTSPAPVVTITPQSVTVDVSPPGLEGFGPVLVATTGTTLSNTAVPAILADNITIAGTGANRTITGTGFNYTDIGTYTITFTGTDAGGATGTQTFNLTVVPEPTTIAALGMAGLGLIRRRK
jgi:hypothetical protein